MTNSSSLSPSESSPTPSGPTQPAAGDLVGAARDVTFDGPASPDLPSGAVLCGRYRIQHSLGKGGFGGVYLALDLDLHRNVAIKRQIGRHLDDSELARNEAKFIAGLDHPSIVKVFDLIDDEKEGVLIIMEHVAGHTLHERLRRNRLSVARSLELSIEIAEALIHAHSRRIVHRDLKPSNVLLDQTEKAKLSDFGLALGAFNLETAPSNAGTPRYMAPEQIRGESHRIDGRTDLWSLGVILYEMLTGRHPFSGPSRGATFEAILHDEPVPIRQLNLRVSEELENVVMRCLRKRMSERPVSATDLVDDLRLCLAAAKYLDEETGVAIAGPATAIDSPDTRTPRASGSGTHSRPLRVEPKGLRPYSEEDGVHFLDLIPGPRERSGLPESIHFWKRWASCENIDEYASVGVLYGPSGAGKTSFIRAGLINQLDHDICPIFIECRSGDLANRIESAIQSRFHQKSQPRSLSKLLSGLRNEEGGIFGYRKIFIILDQFESWSTTATAEERRSLAEALRHCDGKTLQCLFVVRDDYWSGITEIMQWIDVPLVENRNVRSLELLDPRHAQRVLEGMGRAHGTLPHAPEALSEEQQLFIRKAIEGLSDNDRVVAVHLVMFSQIVRVIPWTPQMLKKQGGVEGACSAYLHQIFETSAAPPAYRRLSAVVADILYELLPAQGDPLRASAKSMEDLRGKVLGANAGSKCAEAVRVLSEDLKLITPTRSEKSIEPGITDTEGYQLAHDFLVEPVRNWVELVRKSTWRGRAVARLIELSELWQRKPQAQFFPSLREYAAMQYVVPSSSRNEKQAKYLRAAGRYHAGKVAGVTIAAIAAVVFAVLAYTQYSARLAAEEQRRNVVLDGYLLGPPELAERHLNSILESPRHAQAAARRWIDSIDPKVKVRATLLALKSGSEPDVLGAIAGKLTELDVELLPQLLSVIKTPETIAILNKAFADPAIETRAKARLAIVLLYAGDDAAVRKMLPISPYSAERESVIREAFVWRAGPEPWEKLANLQGDLDAQYGGFAVLGTFKTNDLQGVDWKKIDAMRSSPLCAVHNLAEWEMGVHQIEPNRAPAAPPAGADWMRNSLGIEMRRLEPGEIAYRAFPHSEEPETIKTDQPFWASVTPVTRTLYERFRKEVQKYPSGKEIPAPYDLPRLNNELEFHPDRPVARISIDSAILFSNWASRNEGLAERYAFVESQKLEDREGKEYTVLKWRLNENADGYRLLKEAEFKYACLGGVSEGAPWRLASLINERRDLLQSAASRDEVRLVRETLPNPLGLFIQDEAFGYWLEDPELTRREVTLFGEKQMDVGANSANSRGIIGMLLLARD